MLNEFVSLVISSNEQHRKLMERLALLEKQLPVALIEIPISSKQGKTQNGREVETGEVSCVIMWDNLSVILF